MKTILLHPLNDKVVVPTQTKVLDTLLASSCEVAMACGGNGICATCHVFIRKGREALSPYTEREKKTLGLLTGSDASSRLACQARIIGEGVVVELPEGMYLRAASDLLSLIGRRAEVSILHPKDGRVLIEKGKIITKSKILELENESLDIFEVRSHTELV
jgi:ferredoxin